MRKVCDGGTFNKEKKESLFFCVFFFFLCFFFFVFLLFCRVKKTIFGRDWPADATQVR